MSWRVARSLLVLRAECDERWPTRDRASDGMIGDASHASHTSDHNPWVKDAEGIGVVRALDVDAGPGLNPDEAHDQVGDQVTKAVIAAAKAGHPAMGPGSYVIHERKIASANSSPPWSWRPYSGVDPHTSHPHISVGLHHYDSAAPWGVAAPAAPPQRVIKHKPGSRTLARGVKAGYDMHWLRVRLGMRKAGKFGGLVEKNVRRFQRQNGLPVDGVVGPKTWRKLLKGQEK